MVGSDLKVRPRKLTLRERTIRVNYCSFAVALTQSGRTVVSRLRLVRRLL